MINHKIPKLTKQFRCAPHCTSRNERHPLEDLLASAVNLCLQISGNDAFCLSSVLVLLMLRKHFLKVDMIKQFFCIHENYCTVFAGRGKESSSGDMMIRTKF